MAVTFTWFFHGYTRVYNTNSNSFGGGYKPKNKRNTYARSINYINSSFMEVKTTYGPKGKVKHEVLVKQIKDYLKTKPSSKNEKG